MCFRFPIEKNQNKPSQLLKKIYKHRIHKEQNKQLLDLLDKHKRDSQERFSYPSAKKQQQIFPLRNSISRKELDRLQCHFEVRNWNNSSIDQIQNRNSYDSLYSNEKQQASKFFQYNSRSKKRSERKIRKLKTQLEENIHKKQISPHKKIKMNHLPKLPSCFFCEKNYNPLNKSRKQENSRVSGNAQKISVFQQKELSLPHQKHSNFFKSTKNNSNSYLRSLKKHRNKSKLKTLDQTSDQNKSQLQKTIQLAIKKNQMNLHINYKKDSNQKNSMEVNQIRKLISTQLLKIRMKNNI